MGRTGTYVVIDAMLRQMLAIGKLDIDGYLAYIRSQRNFLIQTLEQYIFVHDVLLEAVSRRMVVNPPPELFSPSAISLPHQQMSAAAFTAPAARSPPHAPPSQPHSSSMATSVTTSTLVESSSRGAVTSMTMSPSSSINMSQGTSTH